MAGLYKYETGFQKMAWVGAARAAALRWHYTRTGQRTKPGHG
jgi:hypothetical protein